jgi:hypothetical protein
MCGVRPGPSLSKRLLEEAGVSPSLPVFATALFGLMAVAKARADDLEADFHHRPEAARP